ncbi:hypothetical protein IscW_ISCW009903 [Ixodes scapularis]|uniref:Uncharacterized protein n=1 Tax=Ixodes scapularis TaxID=6945 RepID=B7PYH9_IXOSC|nr:hypothetical protein IscW_ISCW009903 [Ixodes scapularis]|eukprot:XP_002403136.1 hypothetical protein IscW_ISCW009903 [Ixodes scapularis]
MFLGRGVTTTARLQSGCMSHLGGDGYFGQRLFGSKPAREEHGRLLGGAFQPYASGDFCHRVYSCLEGSIDVSKHYHGAAGRDDTRCCREDFGYVGSVLFRGGVHVTDDRAQLFLLLRKEFNHYKSITPL